VVELGTLTDAELRRRGSETLVASWEEYARGARGAAVLRRDGAAIAVFPDGPERDVYNNALLEPYLAAREVADAVDAIEGAYTDAGVGRFAAWVHESDAAARSELGRRGYPVVEVTRAMGMALDDIRLPLPDVELGPPDWSEYLRIVGVPTDFLAGADRSAYHVVVARLGGENVAAAMAFERDGDCGIYNVGTLEHARRRGLATSLTTVLAYRALARGCLTASLQSTPAAERVYARVGFRDLGRILEYAPETRPGVRPAAATGRTRPRARVARSGARARRAGHRARSPCCRAEGSSRCHGR
jgi:ribosomal protein S18 acetylase RimI-like enzyme